jgi:hypothetical protein
MRCILALAALSLAMVIAPTARAEEDESGGGFLRGALLYLPNRLCDLSDVVRARVRVGPGVAFQARVTEAADIYLGSHLSVFAGIHGPRGGRRIPWPVGIEENVGLEISFLDLTPDTDDAKHTPHYGPAEIGAGLQLVIVGVDVGVEPYELLDFVAGLVTIDLRDDDF